VKRASFQSSEGSFGSQCIRTDRDNEYFAFLRVTQKLKNASKSDNRYAMIEAASESNQLWTIIAADLAHEENGLPLATKAGLLSLAIYSLKQGRRVISECASVEPLIEINVMIMRGLRGDVHP